MIYKFIFFTLFLSFPLLVCSQDADQETKPDTTDGKFKQHFRVDSTGWIDMSDRLIFGCETGTYNTWFMFSNIKNNYSPDLYDVNKWQFRSGYSPLSNSYYLATRYGKFWLYSHRILSNSAVSGKSSTKYVSYGYSHLFRTISVALSYKNTIGFRRTNHYEFPYLNVDDTLKSLSVKDYKLSVELIAKHNLEYKKYGFSNFYFPVKASAGVNLMLESSLFRMLNNAQNIIPYYWFNYSTGFFMMDATKFMKGFSIFAVSANFHASAVFPMIKRKGERPYSFFARLDYIWGLNFYRYKNETMDQGDLYSEFRMAMANSAGTIQLVYADRHMQLSTGINLRVIKFNELARKDEIVMNFYNYYLFVNAGFRIPFKKGYEKINSWF